jgi:hypothetical protein
MLAEQDFAIDQHQGAFPGLPYARLWAPRELSRTPWKCCLCSLRFLSRGKHKADVVQSNNHGDLIPCQECLRRNPKWRNAWTSSRPTPARNLQPLNQPPERERGMGRRMQGEDTHFRVRPSARLMHFSLFQFLGIVEADAARSEDIFDPSNGDNQRPITVPRNLWPSSL